MWFIDAYRKENKIILWVKTTESNIRLEQSFSTSIFVDVKAREILDQKKIAYKIVSKKTYMRNYKTVLEVKIPYLAGFEDFIKLLERLTVHRIPFFNADIIPEQQFVYAHDLVPCGKIEIDSGKIVPIRNTPPVQLEEIALEIRGNPITHIKINDRVLRGEEKDVLEQFISLFNRLDPDVIRMKSAFSALPILDSRIRHHGLKCNFHRWDAFALKSRGGRSYWSYNTVRYQDYAIRLHGRLLIDTLSFMGSECETDAIVELSQLSGTLIQHCASRSFGAVFQTALVREMMRRNIMIPFKEKPIEPPLSMADMLKTDRGGHNYDPKVGFSKNVAEIDFISMFPWLIYNHNISADAILDKKGPFQSIPNTPFTTSLRYKGLIPIALKPFIDRRMYYKKNPTAVNKKRAAGLKWVLVSCYGYLRFREFKLGIPSSHMAICSYARETLLQVMSIAEDHGFEVVHGIVDCLYVTKKDIDTMQVRKLCDEIELVTGIPVHFEGLFKWMVFLPSVVDKDRALPSTYYGVFKTGEIKARGIEVRQHSAPKIVQYFQKEVLSMLGDCDSALEIRQKIPFLCQCLRQTVRNISQFDPSFLVTNIRVSRTDYKHNIPQKKIVVDLKKKGVDVLPGHFINYIFSQTGPVLVEDYSGDPDVLHYQKLLIRALFIVVQPFGWTKDMITNYILDERQTVLIDYIEGSLEKICFEPVQKILLAT